jgi:hypothetical protein
VTRRNKHEIGSTRTIDIARHPKGTECRIAEEFETLLSVVPGLNGDCFGYEGMRGLGGDASATIVAAVAVATFAVDRLERRFWLIEALMPGAAGCGRSRPSNIEERHRNPLKVRDWSILRRSSGS